MRFISSRSLISQACVMCVTKIAGVKRTLFGFSDGDLGASRLNINGIYFIPYVCKAVLQHGNN